MDKVQKPWGSYTVLYEDNLCKVKQIIVKPGGILSLQRHKYRKEHWFIVSGTAAIETGNKSMIKKPGDSVNINKGELHRISNGGLEPGFTESEDLIFIEIQTGSYFGEDDIERAEDKYNRINMEDN